MRYSYTRLYEWSSDIAYLVGLMASDGCLSNDGRHLDITSNDLEQLRNFLKAINRDLKITEKKNQHIQTAYRIQFSDVALYDFLLGVGLTPNKSKTIGNLSIPDIYYPDFLRGLYDGDGSSNSFWDKRWRSSYMFYTKFSSASPEFIKYISRNNSRLFSVGPGSIQKSINVLNLSYAKKDSKILYSTMYYSSNLLHLTRKQKKLFSFINMDEIAKLK